MGGEPFEVPARLGRAQCEGNDFGYFFHYYLIDCPSRFSSVGLHSGLRSRPFGLLHGGGLAFVASGFSVRSRTTNWRDIVSNSVRLFNRPGKLF